MGKRKKPTDPEQVLKLLETCSINLFAGWRLALGDMSGWGWPSLCRRIRTAIRKGDFHAAVWAAFKLGQTVEDWWSWPTRKREELREEGKLLVDQKRAMKSSIRAGDARDRVVGLMNGKGLRKLAACQRVAGEEGVSLRTVQRWCRQT